MTTNELIETLREYGAERAKDGGLAQQMRHITFGCIAALKSAEKESAENAHANICPIKETKITLHSDGRVDIDPPVPKCLASVENGLFRNLG